jgi:hypothetical protein
MASRYTTVDFGSGSGGLSNVGFTIYSAGSGAEYQARTETGVVELGTNTGIYHAPLNLSDNTPDLVIVWDDNSSNYAVVDSFASLNSIQNETDNIHKIMNTIKQNADYEGEVLRNVAKLNGLILKPEEIEAVVSRQLQSNDAKLNETNESVLKLNLVSDEIASEMEKLVGGNLMLSNKMDSVSNGASELNPEDREFLEEMKRSISQMNDLTKVVIERDDIKKALDSANEIKRTHQSFKDQLTSIADSFKQLVDPSGDITEGLPEGTGYRLEMMVHMVTNMSREWIGLKESFQSLAHNLEGSVNRGSDGNSKTITQFKADIQKDLNQLNNLGERMSKLEDLCLRVFGSFNKKLDAKIKMDFIGLPTKVRRN